MARKRLLTHTFRVLLVDQMLRHAGSIEFFLSDFLGDFRAG